MERQVAIATIWDGDTSYRCAILHFCQHAQSFARLLTRHVIASNVDLWMLLVGDGNAGSDTASKESPTVHSGLVVASDLLKKRARKSCINDACTTSRLRVRVKQHLDISEARAAIADECPQMRTATIEPRLRAAVAAFSKTGCRVPWTRLMMYKWWATSLAPASLVIFADLDLQLLRPDQPSEEVIAPLQPP